MFFDSYVEITDSWIDCRIGYGFLARVNRFSGVAHGSPYRTYNAVIKSEWKNKIDKAYERIKKLVLKTPLISNDQINKKFK